MSNLCYRCLLKTMENDRCTSCGALASDQPAPDSGLLPVGTLLDRGSIIVGMPLGRGGFGATYIARDLQSNQLIALKEFVPHYMMMGRHNLAIQIMPAKQTVFERSLRDFRRESRILGTLNHPNIIRVYFDMQENNTAYYGMELLNGKDLRKWVMGRLPMKAEEAYEMLDPIMDALTYIHSKRMYHRDISPDNMFIRFGNQYPKGYSPCLIDFGAACCAKSDFTQTSPNVKKSGFSPIEQNWGLERQGSFTDVYALAATFYYLLTGRVPVPSSDRNMQNDPLVPPSKINPALSREVDNVILRAMAIAPTKRTQTVLEFKNGLAKALGMKVQYSAPPQQPVQQQPVQQQPVQQQPVQQQPVQQQPVQQQPVQQPVEKRPGKLMLAWLLDALFLVGVPTALLSPVSPLIGFLLGMGLMLLLNTILCCVDPSGTLGQRIVSLTFDRSDYSPSGAQVFLYNLLRVLLPVSLIDEICGVCGSNPQSFIEKLTDVCFVKPNAAQAMPASDAYSMISNESFVPGRVNTPIAPAAPVNVQEQMRHVQQAVQQNHQLAALYCISGHLKGCTFPLKKYNSIGRRNANLSESASILFPDVASAVSRKHCIIMLHDDNCWYVQDVGSANGTKLNGTPLAPLTYYKLVNNAQLTLGEEVLVFRQPS